MVLFLIGVLSMQSGREVSRKFLGTGSFVHSRVGSRECMEGVTLIGSSSGLPPPRGMLSPSLASNRRAASAAIDQVALAAPAPLAAAGFVDSWLAKVSPQVVCEMIPQPVSGESDLKLEK